MSGSIYKDSGSGIFLTRGGPTNFQFVVFITVNSEENTVRETFHWVRASSSLAASGIPDLELLPHRTCL